MVTYHFTPFRRVIHSFIFSKLGNCCPNNKNELNTYFLFHYLEYKKDYLIVPLMKGGANVSLHIEDIAKIKVPVPPLDVQQRIVEVLDKFEKICTDLKIGLPAEISARQQQYEYYRDKLLTFERRMNDDT